MTERTAIALVAVVTSALTAAAVLALAAIHASGEVLGLAMVLILAVGVDTSSKIVMHYADKRNDEQHY